LAGPCDAQKARYLLGSRLPAAVLADKFDIHRTTADRRVKTAGGGWARYAADRSRTG
jgi:hypothetical protein